MHMDDEVAHLGVVDGALGGGFPGSLGFGIARENADDIELRHILELVLVESDELAAEHEVEKLLAGFRAHDGSIPLRCPGFSICLTAAYRCFEQDRRAANGYW